MTGLQRTLQVAAQSWARRFWMGNKNVGTWQIEEVHIVNDYEKALRTDPPPIASLAIMNDSDNTGERAVSSVDYIQIYR